VRGPSRGRGPRRQPRRHLRHALPRRRRAPVGYAVVDAESRIRYRTLDPTVTAELSEVRTILEAL